MNLTSLESFARQARVDLMRAVETMLHSVLALDSVARRTQPRTVRQLERDVEALGEASVIEKTAYLWFNRFCALRFMDVNGYTRIRCVSPAEGGVYPEILSEAQAGVFDSLLEDESKKQEVLDILAGVIATPDPHRAAYRVLFVAMCNAWHSRMPFLFEKINDYTELLLPEDLLSSTSILADVRNALTPEACQNVEVIGWLYQFYISEKKETVYDRLKKATKLKTEDIPAATQLFTPEWIVRYMTENSLGRLWMRNNPGSGLTASMPYYIADPENYQPTATIEDPTQISVCDPACGSGHILVYAFDLLYLMYEEFGYAPHEIPELILTHNLYGVEIDERAASLASFALVMKACQRYSRFLRKAKVVRPKICHLKKIVVEDDSQTVEKVKCYSSESGIDRAKIFHDLRLFEKVEFAGSLLVPDMTLAEIQRLQTVVEAHVTDGELFERQFHVTVLLILRQLEFLVPRYHAVIANPPYLGSSGMVPEMALWLRENYEDVKSDLFSAFIVRNLELTSPHGVLGLMTPFVWMFISSYEKLRAKLISNHTISSLVQLEYSGFAGATVPICTFTLDKDCEADYQGGYVRLSDFKGSDIQGPKTLEIINAAQGGKSTAPHFYRANAKNFLKIPGSPIAYWASEAMIEKYERASPVGDTALPRHGLATSDNNRFLKIWYEVSNNKTSLLSRCDFSKKWFPMNKGGAFRKWYGNLNWVINYENDGRELKDFAIKLYKSSSRTIQNTQYYFREGLTWSALTSGALSFRWTEKGAIFGSGAHCAFVDDPILQYYALAFLNSKVNDEYLKIVSPTLNTNVDDIRNVPLVFDGQTEESVKTITIDSIQISKSDWDSFETSWDFEVHPLIQSTTRIADAYRNWEEACESRFALLKANEEELNRIFIDLYGLQDELTPEVEEKDVTVRRADLKRDVKSFISYAVGCMLGRYALEKPRLILANAGETLQDYLNRVGPTPRFMPDDDGVIPVLAEDCFPDDIVGRFEIFVKTVFGLDHFAENLAFIEDALGKSLRDYFVKDFYADHVQVYQKRPIYWMFSSPKGHFNALIYLHRYRPDTIGVVLSYVRSYLGKLQTLSAMERRTMESPETTPSARAKATKAYNKYVAMIKDIEAYDHTLYDLSTSHIELDLDDGVKVNYPKFKGVLKKVVGLS